MQQAAAAAANFYDFVELTESHHNQKADAPSGTCIKTAELIEEFGKTFNQSQVEERIQARATKFATDFYLPPLRSELERVLPNTTLEIHIKV